MKLPNIAARWVDKQTKMADDAHSAHCLAHGLDADDIDPPESWRENLNLWFPLEIAGGSWQRSIDWAEIRGTIEIAIWCRLPLCKLGWHRYGMVHRWENYAQCRCGKRRYGWLPRWAR